MVSKVISGKDIKGAINYNERKVIEGKATILQASGFLKEAVNLTFYEKLDRFVDLNKRNTRTKTNTLHVTLNFDPSERINQDELRSISSTYMNKIGFGDQPYLVYEHTDAAHQHVHIVTTLIQQTGKRIPIHYLGKNQSEKARKEIEIEFGLVKADSKKKALDINPISVQKVIYGKAETKRSISNVVRSVTKSYKYATLPELNAALRQFNVTADRGSENSRMFQKNGLVYSLIDENGKRIGIPVKASSIYSKPTLAFLEKQFKLNEVLRKPNREPLKKLIEKVLQSPTVNSLQQFSSALQKYGVETVFRNNAEGRTYGVTFVDNNRQVVFNGSALGKAYSVNAIMENLSAKNDSVKLFRPGYSELKQKASKENTTTALTQKVSSNTTPSETHREISNTTLLDDLLKSESATGISPEAALRLGRRRRKKRGKRL